MYQWSDEYTLGVEEIDKQHRRLIELADQVYLVLNDPWRLDKYNQILEVLGELKDYTIYHFKAEEEYMLKIGYKKRFSHAIAHNSFVEKLSAVDLKEVDEAQEQYLMELLNFITDWIVTHIMKTDRLYTQQQPVL